MHVQGNNKQTINTIVFPVIKAVQNNGLGTLTLTQENEGLYWIGKSMCPCNMQPTDTLTNCYKDFNLQRTLHFFHTSGSMLYFFLSSK